jgi:hypothetical protein
MRWMSLISCPLVRKAMGSLLSVLVNDFCAMHAQGSGGKGGAHDVAGRTLLMSVLARYGIGCDLAFAEYSVIRFVQAIKAMSERR